MAERHGEEKEAQERVLRSRRALCYTIMRSSGLILIRQITLIFLSSIPSRKYLIIPGRTVVARRPETTYRLAKVGSVLCVCVRACVM